MFPSFLLHCCCSFCTTDRGPISPPPFRLSRVIDIATPPRLPSRCPLGTVTPSHRATSRVFRTIGGLGKAPSFMTCTSVLAGSAHQHANGRRQFRLPVARVQGAGKEFLLAEMAGATRALPRRQQTLPVHRRRLWQQIQLSGTELFALDGSIIISLWNCETLTRGHPVDGRNTLSLQAADNRGGNEPNELHFRPPWRGT